jgi:predicted MFS family arabinose efflux permease
MAGTFPGKVPATVSPVSDPGRLAAVICVAEILGMAPFSMFLALQPQLHDRWGLSNTASGWISSAYYAGYMVAVPVLSSLTDRLDARTVWLGSTALAVVATLGFGLTAEGLWTAWLFQFLAGASLGGTYMPGLKVLADRMGGIPHPRFVGFYTTAFTVGASLSFAVIGQLAEWFSWRTAIVLVALGPFLAWLLMFASLPPVTARPSSHTQPRAHWQQVLRSAASMRYVFGYACHMWELFAIRAWLVAFLTFCEGVQGRPAFASAATLAGLLALVGVPASLAGAEMSARADRRRLVLSVMLISSVTSLAFGATAATSWAVILIAAIISSAFVSADSAALTSGIVAVSPPESRGTAMAIYSMAGFAAASAGAFAVGALLDLLGGQSIMSWIVAFGVMGASNLVGAFLLWKGE